MARLIDADALMKRFYNYYDCVNEFTGKNGYRGDTLMDYEVADMIYNCIENAPTVDAKPVVHGRWQRYTDEIFTGYDSRGRIKYRKRYTYECTCCGENKLSKTNYCPNCGADMREE